MANRLIKTGLKGKINNKILSGVLGHWSDGQYEGMYGFFKYWGFADITSNNDILIDTTSRKRIGNGYTVNNGFAKMSDAEVKAFFAKYIRAILNLEHKYNPERNLSWNAHNYTVVEMFGDGDVTIADCWTAYQALRLNPRKSKTVSPLDEVNKAFAESKKQIKL